MRKTCVRFWWALAALLAAMAVSVGVACDGSGGTEGTIVIKLTTPTATVMPTPTPSPTPAPSPSPTVSAQVCGVNPDPAPASVLQVQEPASGERVKNPVHVRGWGSDIGFENSGVAVALVQANGDPLPPLDVPPQPRAGRVAPSGLKVTEFTSPFGADLLVADLRSPTPFCIWVFLETTAEGIPKQVVQVPVVIAP